MRMERREEERRGDVSRSKNDRDISETQEEAEWGEFDLSVGENTEDKSEALVAQLRVHLRDGDIAWRDVAGNERPDQRGGNNETERSSSN